ncbi:oxysterol-binding protein-related protein 9 isoform X3 [Choristoneura fumiferana]|uniref:oxysterol-binding protein-related protein 9 isoform X2 n=1 Tax=Choristoneura fumiferana TaxID=7141 RepID=UPI003D15DF74
MIELVSKMTIRVSELADPHEKANGQIILDHSNAMLDNIKHSIVLLQIAKNTVNPVNGVYQGPTSTSQTHIKQGSSDVSPHVELGSECRELSTPTHPLPLEAIDAPKLFFAGQAMSLLVPDTSYSSSEGEDDFFDADDGVDIVQPGPSASRNCPAEGAPEVDSAPPVDLPRTRDGEIDYDALYEEESDSELGSMENHGSVVTHLLSQVKIGMDLTKVVLPTFILERRSLLEMYADSFAHPDQFVKIVDQPTPRDRMIQVVRWYLSSFHAGRKSQVAKKPYNPILGEVFRCHWELDGNETQPVDKVEVGEGPVPWCSPDQLSFVAEQVSHHPPISAFYAEHVNKRIQFEAWVWTKSKFLGLSIGVHNIGKGTVTLLDTGEEYTLTFPNGYGRSILTVPWIELGGSVCIECAQTGHRANVEFLTKPFYGGKKHRVTCEVFAGTEKKPYYTAQGEWNTRVDGRWTESGRTEVLFEVANMKPRRKRVAPVSRQTPLEARRVWRHVTAALRAADTDQATAAKSRVEQAQRDQAKARQANGDQWDTQVPPPRHTDQATAAKSRVEQAQRDQAKARQANGDQWDTQVPPPRHTDQATAAKSRVEQAQRDQAKARQANGDQWDTQVPPPRHTDQATAAKSRVEQAQRDQAKARQANGDQWDTQVPPPRHTDQATAAKSRVEQAQRDQAKARQANGDQWDTQLFSPKGSDGWEYNAPLSKRRGAARAADDAR